jgi:homoaconitate hydratase
MGLEVPRLVERLRPYFSSHSSVDATERQPTRWTGWTLTWDVKRSVVEVREGEEGDSWTEQVGELPAKRAGYCCGREQRRGSRKRLGSRGG